MSIAVRFLQNSMAASFLRRSRDDFVRDWRAIFRLLLNPWLFLKTVSRGLANDWPRVLLVVVSASLAMYYLHGKPFIIYDDSDPLTYIREAWSIIGRVGGYDAPYRGPGYSLFLIATGVANLDIWWLAMGLQLLFAIVMPVIIYQIMAPFSRAAGLAAGLCFIFYGIAYNHMNWVMSEMLFIFIQFILFLLMSLYFQQRHTSNLVIWIAITASYLTMIRPSGALYFWIFVVVALIYRRFSFKKLGLAVCCYASVMVAWGTYDYYYGNGKFPSGYNPQNHFQRAFAKLYYQRGTTAFDPESYKRIRREDGPASEQLYAVVDRYIKKNRGGTWKIQDEVSRNTFFESFSDDAQLLENIFRNPNFLYFYFIVNAARDANENSDNLLYKVAKEHGGVGVRGLFAHFAQHPLILITGPPQTYVGRMLLANFIRHTDMEALNYYFVGSMRDIPMGRHVGPANREIIDTLHRMIDLMPGYTIGDPNNYLSIFKDADSVKKYISKPYFKKADDGREVLGMIEGSMYIWLSIYNGELYTDRLMKRAAFEIIADRPTVLFSFLDTFLRITLMRNFNLDYSGSSFASFSEFLEHVRKSQWKSKDMRSSVLPERLAKHLIMVEEFRNTPMAVLDIGYRFVSRLLKLPFFMIMILTIVPVLFIKNLSPLALTLFIIYCYNVSALTVVVGVFDLPRYEDLFMFMPVMLSFLGINAVYVLAKRSWID